MAGAHHKIDELFWQDKGETEEARIRLFAGESAENPASTKHSIWGPAVVKYVRYPDGGITATVHSVKSITGAC